MAGFRSLLNGRFDGMIRVDDLENLCQRMAGYDSWYAVAPGQPHGAPESGERVTTRLRELVDEILREERGVWTTMVYVQAMEDPLLVKVFHPRRAGCGCGTSKGIKPWWVFSRVEPEPVPEWNDAVCELPKPPIWQRLF
ncbi:MAG: hypothetical protein HQL56_02355 [Magnetococcales bacterium]|nr:hypothetical protein [Magnetococcales bacterium]